jgi:Flp pilus assembly protein TadD
MAINAPVDLVQLFQASRHREVVQVAQQQGVNAQAQPLLAQVVAASLFKLGEYGQALPLLEQLEASLGQEVDYLTLLASTCRRLGLLDRARTAFERALALAPESPAVRNNYANLLIDLDRYAEAEAILNALLAANPGYEDARANLNRLRFKQQPVAPAPVAPPAAPAASAAGQPLWSPLDPLMLAFSEEEVALAGGGAIQAKPANPPSQLAGHLPEPQQAAMAAEQLQLAQQAVRDGNAPFALQLCSQARSVLGPTQAVYINASDAYIRLQRFHEAEICLLTGLTLGTATVSHYINLVSLACLRGDADLANHYLEAAAAIDPENPSLAQVRQQVQHCRQQTATKPYAFAQAWQVPQLNAKPAS